MEKFTKISALILGVGIILGSKTLTTSASTNKYIPSYNLNSELPSSTYDNSIVNKNNIDDQNSSYNNNNCYNNSDTNVNTGNSCYRNSNRNYQSKNQSYRNNLISNSYLNNL